MGVRHVHWMPTLRKKCCTTNDRKKRTNLREMLGMRRRNVGKSAAWTGAVGGEGRQSARQDADCVPNTNGRSGPVVSTNLTGLSRNSESLIRCQMTSARNPSTPRLSQNLSTSSSLRAPVEVGPLGEEGVVVPTENQIRA